MPHNILELTKLPEINFIQAKYILLYDYYYYYYYDNIYCLNRKFRRTP